MQHIIIGNSYKALLGDGKIHTFVATEDDGEMLCTRWDDGDEDWNYPEDLFRLMQAAKDKEEEERYPHEIPLSDLRKVLEHKYLSEDTAKRV